VVPDQGQQHLVPAIPHVHGTTWSDGMRSHCGSCGSPTHQAGDLISGNDVAAPARTAWAELPTPTECVAHTGGALGSC
jgi:hypothetical protein